MRKGSKNLRANLLGLAALAALLSVSPLRASSLEDGVATRQSASNNIDRKQRSELCSIQARDIVSKQSDATLVDVRTSHDYEINWIPGAVQLSLVEVARSNLVAATDQAILIGNGKNDVQLLEYCKAQHRLGLQQVRVLIGGVPAWVDAGGVVAGNATKALEPLLLVPGELHALLVRDHVPLIFAGLDPTGSSGFSNQHLIEVAADAPPKKAFARLSRQSAESASYVVFLQTSELVDEWRSAAKSQGLADPLFFIGDLSQYDAYLTLQDSIAKALEESQTSTCEPK